MLWANDAEGYICWRAQLPAIRHESRFLCFVLMIMLSLHFIAVYDHNTTNR